MSQMPQSNSATLPIGFGIFDFITRVIPGGLLAGAITVIIRPGFFTGSISTSQLAFFGVASYVIGEFANTLRMYFFPVPVSFTRLIYEQSGGQTRQHIFDRWRDSLPYLSPKNAKIWTQTSDEFWSNIADQFNLSEYERTRDVYFLFLNYINPSLNLRTHRLQALYHLATNLLVTGMIGIFFAIYLALVPDNPLIGSLLAILLIMVVLAIIASFYGMIETLYVQHLLREYQSIIVKGKSDSVPQPR